MKLSLQSGSNSADVRQLSGSQVSQLKPCVAKNVRQCGIIMLFKGPRVNFGLILYVPHRMRSALETYLSLSCLQQAMSPDVNSNGQLHLMKKSSPAIYSKLKIQYFASQKTPLPLNISQDGRSYHRGNIFYNGNFHAKVNILRVGRSKTKQNDRKAKMASLSSQLSVFL